MGPAAEVPGWSSDSPFFPRSRLLSEWEGCRGGKRSAAVEWRAARCTARCTASGALALGPPAEGECTADQRPMPATGTVSTHLKVGPAQLLLDRFVALLDPLPQAIQPHDLGQVCRGKRRVCVGPWRGGQRQIGDQVPGAGLGQRARIAGRHHHPVRALGPLRAAQFQIHRPPRLFVSVMEAAHHRRPGPRSLGIVRGAPAQPVCRLGRATLVRGAASRRSRTA